MSISKVAITLIHFSLLLISSYANDTMFTVKGGDLTLIDSGSSEVRLIKEKLYMHFYDQYYQVIVEYEFYNEGNELSTKLGFPIRVNTVNTDIKDIKVYVTGFDTAVNGQYVPFEVIKQPIQSTNESGHYKEEYTEIWYVKNVTFQKGCKTEITIKYNSDYGSEGVGSCLAYYYYGSGVTWKNGIELLELYIQTHEKQILYYIKSPRTFTIDDTHWNKSQLLINNSTFIVSKDDQLRFELTDFSELDYIDNYFSDGCNKNWSINYRLLTIEQLKLLRNGFYAFHNYRFKSKELIDFFTINMSAYKPLYYNVDDKLTDKQKKIIEDILQEEKKRKT